MLKIQLSSSVNRFLTPKNAASLLNYLRDYSTPTDLHSYTNELYKKNYIQYPVQSQLGVTHDYVFHGDERLPTLEERMKGKKRESEHYFGHKSHN
jgi:hypothetical protein